MAETAGAATAPRLAGVWRRLGAFVLDGLGGGGPLLFLGFAAYDWAVALGQAGRALGFAVALAYFGALNSTLGGGQTLGKRLLGLRVVDRQGQRITLPRSLLRCLVLWVPWFLNGVFITA